MGRLFIESNYHVAILRSQLTRNIGVLLGDLIDEIDFGFREYVGINKGNIVLDHIHVATRLKKYRMVLGTGACDYDKYSLYGEQ